MRGANRSKIGFIPGFEKNRCVFYNLKLSVKMIKNTSINN